MNYFRTLSKAVNYYTDRGYTFSFDFDNTSAGQENWAIVQTHRFEGDSNPSDNAILYALEHKNGKDKGIIVDAYGAACSARKCGWLKRVKRSYPTDLASAEQPYYRSLSEELTIGALYHGDHWIVC